MYRLRLSSLAIFLSCFCISIHAQSITDSVYVFVPAKISGSEGQTINIPVKVNRFKSILSAQIKLNWDSTVLKFVNISNFGLAGITNAQFATKGERPSELRFSWLDNSIIPQTIKDGNSIFDIEFKIIGKNGQQTALTFDKDFFEFLDVDSKELKVGSQSSIVQVGTTSTDTDPLNLHGIYIQKPQPNPFLDQTIIPIQINDNQELRLSLFDTNGKKIYESSSFYEVGTHFVNINKNNNILNSGIYYYQIQTKDGSQFTGKLMKI